MRLELVGAVLAGAALLATPAAADVHVTVANGRASVSASGATVQQILEEWARVGQVRLVNAEQLGGAPMTLELVDVPELQALDIILRSVSGYVAAPRAVAVANASHYDRILILKASSPAPARPMPAPVAAQAPTPPVFQPPPQQPDDDQVVEDDGARPQGQPPGAQAPPARPSFNNTFPQQQREVPEPPQGPASYPAPTSPAGGVSTPGMPVPVPQQPGQPRR